MTSNIKTNLSDLNYFVPKDYKAKKGKPVCAVIDKVQAEHLKKGIRPVDSYKGDGYLINGADLKEFCVSKTDKGIAKNKKKFAIIKVAAIVAVVALAIILCAIGWGVLLSFGLILPKVVALFLSVSFALPSLPVFGATVAMLYIDNVIDYKRARKESEVSEILNNIKDLERSNKAEEEKAIELLNIVKLSSKEINLMIKKKEADAMAKAKKDLVLTEEQVKQKMLENYNLNDRPAPQMPKIEGLQNVSQIPTLPNDSQAPKFPEIILQTV